MINYRTQPLARRDNELTLSTRIAGDFQLRVLDAESRTVEAILSTDAVLDLGYRKERLLHAAENVDLTRAAGGLPLLWVHNQAEPIGVVEDIQLREGRAVGVLRFSDHPLASRVFADVKAGMLKSISVGYRVLKAIELEGGKLIEATRWIMYEASIVAVPADSGALILRSGPAATPPAGNVADFAAAQAAARAEGIAQGQQMELSRRMEIDAIFASPRLGNHTELHTRALSDGWTVQKAKDELLAALGAGTVEVTAGAPIQTRGHGASAGADASDKWAEGAEIALMTRAGLYTPEEAKKIDTRNNEFMGMSLPEIARDVLRRNGVTFGGFNRDRIVSQALQLRANGQGIGDFTGLLENVSNKALLKGYDEAEETWPLIARKGSLPDFKLSSRAGLSEFDDLPIVPENAEYTIGSFGDRVERLQLTTRGKLLRISRQAIVNDDQGAFTDVPRKMGRSAQRAIGDMVYAVLTNNALMGQDGLALFVAGHNNIQSPGAAPTVAQLNAMKALMGKQKDSAVQVNGLNIRLSRVVVPLALEGVARTLQTASSDPAVALNPGTPNIHANTFLTVADARLDTSSAIIWYGLADPNIYDVIEVAFLDGQESPFLESKDGWTIDGVEYKVRLDAVAGALDFRTMTRNAGV